MADDRYRARVVGICQKLASRTGDRRYLDAAARLEGKRAGRPAINDAAALSFAHALLRQGMAKTPYEACFKAASLFAGNQQIETVRERLRKKIGQNIVPNDKP